MKHGGDVLAFARPSQGNPRQQIGGYSLGAVLDHDAWSDLYEAFGPDGDVLLRLYRPTTAKKAHTALHAALSRRARYRSAALLQIAEVGEVSTEHGSCLYTVAPLIQAVTLHSLLQDAQSLPVHRALELADRVFGAGQLLHEQGLVHGALHPRNILVVPDPLRGEHVVFADGGVGVEIFNAYLLPELEAGRTLPPGTVFSAPELVDGREPAPQSDVYALGMVLRQVMQQEYEGTDDIVQSCLNLNPVKRPAHAGALRALLNSVQGDVTRTRTLSMLGIPARATSSSGSTRALWAFAVVAFAALLTIAWAMWPVASEVAPAQTAAPAVELAPAPLSEGAASPVAAEASEVATPEVATPKVAAPEVKATDVGASKEADIAQKRPTTVTAPAPSPRAAPAASRTAPAPTSPQGSATPDAVPAAPPAARVKSTAAAAVPDGASESSVIQPAARPPAESSIGAVKDVRDPWAD